MNLFRQRAPTKHERQKVFFSIAFCDLHNKHFRSGPFCEAIEPEMMNIAFRSVELEIDERKLKS